MECVLLPDNMSMAWQLIRATTFLSKHRRPRRQLPSKQPEAFPDNWEEQG